MVPSAPDLPRSYGAVRPTVHFTDVPFKHSRSMVSTTSTTSNDGLYLAGIASLNLNSALPLLRSALLDRGLWVGSTYQRSETRSASEA